MEWELSKLKTRWFRWLGQKTRIDKPYWVTLLNSSWIGWAASVLDKSTKGKWYPPAKNREAVKDYFHLAILYANHKDLLKLDNLYATEKIER